jgi:hypothetical protein
VSLARELRTFGACHGAADAVSTGAVARGGDAVSTGAVGRWAADAVAAGAVARGGDAVSTGAVGRWAADGVAAGVAGARVSDRGQPPTSAEPRRYWRLTDGAAAVGPAALARLTDVAPAAAAQPAVVGPAASTRLTVGSPAESARRARPAPWRCLVWCRLCLGGALQAWQGACAECPVDA